MLGKLVSEGKWKVVGMTVPDNKTMEVSFQEFGKIYGLEYSGLATIISRARTDGTMYGRGEAMLTNKEGEPLIWNGVAVGQSKGATAISWRGCKIFETLSPKQEDLNKVAVVFEGDVDENGDGLHKQWEWK
jgi:hypothetical protein